MASRRGAAPQMALGLAAVQAAGLLLSVLLALRARVYLEQLELYARGWLFSIGVWIPYGMPTSGGGVAPGGATSLVMGLPLLIWSDYRAVTLAIVALQFAAYLLLDRVLRHGLSPGERLLFALLYWLGPARLYYSGMVWNPSFLPIFAALHLWTAHRQRHHPSWLHSAVHVLALCFAFQLHSSAVLLAAASALLLLRGYMRLSPAGTLLGLALSLAAMAPWAMAVAQDPSLAPTGEGQVLRGLVFFWSGILRGLGYWLRYGCLFVSNKILLLDFTFTLGAGAQRWLAPVVSAASRMLLPLTLLLPLAANYRFLRGIRRRRGWRRTTAGTGERDWLRGYVLWCLAGSLPIFALAPTTVMFWQVFILMHAAVLPVVLWAGPLWRTRRRRQVQAAAWMYGAASIILGLTIAFGHNMYYCNTTPGLSLPLTGDHPMLRQLNIDSTCTYEVNQPDGLWREILSVRPDEPATTTPGSR